MKFQLGGLRLIRQIVQTHAQNAKFSTSPHSTALWKFGGSSNTPATESEPGQGSQIIGSSDSPVIHRGPLPLITSRQLPFLPPHRPPRQAWVENLDSIEETKLGLVDLHPDIWARFPRIDILHRNIHWQLDYKKVDWTWLPNRAELPGSGKKPWPQKGTGRARHGSRRSPLWYHGAKAHGPRGPRTKYFMLPSHFRIQGLCIALSVKLAQDDLKIVDSLDIPSTESKYLEELAEKRAWGVSVLFVDDTDLMPANISLATETIGHLNLMPFYGLNVFSILKHETLVLTTGALEILESKLLFHLHKNDSEVWANRRPKPNHVDLLNMSGTRGG